MGPETDNSFGDSCKTRVQTEKSTAPPKMVFKEITSRTAAESLVKHTPC